MSEGGGSAGPDIGPNYQNSGPPSYSNPPSQPPTPSSTVQDPPNFQNAEVNENSNEPKPNLTSLHSNSASGLPPFSSFTTADVTEGLGGRLAGDGYLTSDGISSTRVMELSGWDYCYTDGLSGRYLERGDSMPVMIPQPQYRPWESKQDGSSDSIKSTLPSFQSQFGEELVTTLTTLTPAACSPAPSVPSPSLPSFHTLSAVNPRYPLVPAPVQAREIPSIQQQFLDERHIHLFQGAPGQNFTLQPQNGLNGQTLTTLNNGTTLTTLNNAQYHPQIINNAQILPSGQILAPQSHILTPSSQIITSNGHIITSSGGQGLTVVSQNSTPTVLTVVKTEPVNIVELKTNSTETPNLTQLHHANFQNPMITQGQQMDSKFGLESPPRGVDGRKKERRKIRASSLESSNESDGAMSVESSGQVAAVSSTAGFKSPLTPGQMNNEDTGEKQTKKKRKRCGECIGCQRKDNCGDCAPCRNDKSHQICKMRRCEKLTEKKHLLAYNREDGGVSYRGRGRGRGRGSRGGYRGKGARPGTQSAQVTSVVGEMNSTPGLVVGSSRENIKVDAGRVSGGPIPGNPALAPTMAVPFYAGTEVWSASTPADPWTGQGQFIHQIDDIRYQHYPGYQTTGYQQSGFMTEQTSAFQPQYTNSNNNPASSPVQGNVTPRSTGSYTQVHTPTPSPNPSTPHVNGHRNGINVHYVEETYVNGTSFNTESSIVPPASTTPNSRSSSVHLEVSDTNTKTSGYMSGNEIPGYPLNSPQCQSSCNSSGYPGQSLQSEFGDQSSNGTSYQSSSGSNRMSQKSPSYTQASPGTYQNYQNYSQVNPDEHTKTVKSNISPGGYHPSQKPSGMYPQHSPKSYSSNPSPQTYQEASPGQNRNVAQTLYENRTTGNGNVYQSERFDQQNYPTPSPSSQNYGQISPNNVIIDKNNVNARLKSMIMNKHQISQNHQQNLPNNNYNASNDNHMMSPNREMMSPSQQNVQMMSPLLQNSQMMSPLQNANPITSPNYQNNHMMPNNQMSSPTAIDSKNYLDKVQQSDSGEKKQIQINENTNHFLAFSHHLRERSSLQPEGGGVCFWNGIAKADSNNHVSLAINNQEHITNSSKNKKSKKKTDKIPAAMESFTTLIHSDLPNKKVFVQKESGFCGNAYIRENPMTQNFCYVSDPIRNLEVNFPTKRNKTENVNNFGVNTKNYPEQKVTANQNVRRSFSCLSNSSAISKTIQEKPFLDKGLGRLQGDVNYSTYPHKESNLNKITTSNTFPFPQFNVPSHDMDYYSETPTVKLKRSVINNECALSCHNIKEEENDIKLDCLKSQFVPSSQSLSSPSLSSSRQENFKIVSERGTNTEPEKEIISGFSAEDSKTSPYQKISYAPNFKNMEVIDKRFKSSDFSDKLKWEKYQKEKEFQSCKYGEMKKEKRNYIYPGEGGPIDLKSCGAWCCRLGGIEPPSKEHLKNGCCKGYQTADEFPPDTEKSESSVESNEVTSKPTPVSFSQASFTHKNDCKSPAPGQDFQRDFQENEKLKNNLRSDVPDCRCFPPDKSPPEPGSYYTHLGAAASLTDLRKDVEARTGQTGKALRIEKICFTGKEGKTTQGCPLAKWIIRRSGLEEKFLIVVKHRQGHTCSAAWIVVCLVAWEGIPTPEADKVYTLLTEKLNKFGLPTTRRCATNEPRTCACQGLNPDTCGASFSFGCSWSMYYNGCKYARSKTVRKFRLSVRSEEQEVEERMHVLATLLSPLYNTLAPDAFHNQTVFEREATECRLGFKPGRPFSGVTACIDFCAHSHRDLHNMNNGCTVVVTLTKHRTLSKPDDEQLHVLPLYIMDETDEYGCKETQEVKYQNGSIECLKKFPCEVRVRAVPLQPCRRHGKKRKDEDHDVGINHSKSKEGNSKNASPLSMTNNASPMQPPDMQSMINGLELQLQSSQVSSTVMDSPVNMYQRWNYQNIPEGDFKASQNKLAAPFQNHQNWIKSPHMSSPWDYSNFTSENDVDPDSTTNQACDSRHNEYINGNDVSKVNSQSKYNSYNFSTSPCQNRSFSQWNDAQRTDSSRNFYISHDFVKPDNDRENNGKTFPQMVHGQWSDCSSVPYSLPQNQAFRMPRGRPPSNHSSSSEQSETYLKPLHKEANKNVSSLPMNIKREDDGILNGEKQWSTGSANLEGNQTILNAQHLNSLSVPSNSPNFNSSHINRHKNNYFNEFKSIDNYGLFESGRKPQVTYNWPERPDKNRLDGGCNVPPEHYNFSNAPMEWLVPKWDFCDSNSYFSATPEPPKSEPIGEVVDFIENEECFKDSQMGGVAIALGHGSVLFECAKHELHATTALKKPNRLHPTRISLVFYQHRNLNRAKHGWEEWEEKMRLRKLGITTMPDKNVSKDAAKNLKEYSSEYLKLAELEKPLGLSERILLKIPTYTTTTWTTLFPMRPCMVTGPYQEGGND